MLVLESRQDSEVGSLERVNGFHHFRTDHPYVPDPYRLFTHAENRHLGDLDFHLQWGGR